jgi:hypothetical protein
VDLGLRDKLEVLSLLVVLLVLLFALR